MIGAFRSGYCFPVPRFPQGVRWFWFRFFLIVGIHASGISVPLSLFCICVESYVNWGDRTTCRKE